MSFWTPAVEACNNNVTEDDFETAADRLVCEQVLYGADRSSKLAYSLIHDFTRQFMQALDPLGYHIRVNSQLRYAGAIPKHTRVAAVNTEQTLLALVLRTIFDEETHAGHHDENGEVACDLVSLMVKYKQTTGGRELPTGGKLSALVQWMRRWGIARVKNEDNSPVAQDINQPYTVIIRPGIAEVLGEAALTRIALFSSSDEDVGPSDQTSDAPIHEGVER